MCGRYTTEIETDEKELFRILEQAAQSAPALRELSSGREVFPSQPAAVMVLPDDAAETDARFFRWGYPTDRQLLINARAETASEKRIFSESLQYRRCIIPTAGFFEWTHSGEKLKFRFNLPDTGILYLAGLYRPASVPDSRYPMPENEFVILTTAANESMAAIHSRMPVILRAEHIENWLYSPKDALRLLKEPQPLLLKKLA